MSGRGGFEEIEACSRTRPVIETNDAKDAALTDEQCDAIYNALNEWAHTVDEYDFGLPQVAGGGAEGGREVIRNAAMSTGGVKDAARGTPDAILRELVTAEGDWLRIHHGTLVDPAKVENAEDRRAIAWRRAKEYVAMSTHRPKESGNG